MSSTTPTLTQILANSAEREKLEQRLWAKVEKSPDSHCWLWTGSKNKSGYGAIKVAGKPLQVHRVVYEMSYGIIPSDHFVRHRCDNPSCCNPKHLKLGSNQDNVDDRTLRGRSVKGSKQTTAKLTEYEVEEIIRELQGSFITTQAIAQKYGVVRSVVSRINTGKSWTHVSPHLSRPIRPYDLPRGTPDAKLNVDQVKAIRHRYNLGEKQCDLAREFQVSLSAISNLVNFQTWAGVV
ncbi:HNH endonuclease [Synechocystis sp. PCC 7509]|uniref:HNH endonuclease n=1 Tax=Synechocystis sp. PCC 7509 TaxID=927677 RepID=UPI000302A2D6|nr:HNH endonuclease [Synechocystis sp. PCC 7509]